MSQLGKLLGEFPQGFRNAGQDLKLTGVGRLKFLRSEWESIEFTEKNVVSLPYLFYRLIFCTYFLVFLCLSITATSNPGLWGTLATNWNFLTQTIYAVATFTNIFVFWCRQTFSSKGPPFYHENVNWFESFIWFCLNLTYSVPQFISITYWLFVFGADSIPEGISTGTVVGFSLTVHGINAILSLVDVFVVAAPIRVTHFIYPVLMNGAYLLFSGLYEVAGGTYRQEDKPYIYPILNWRESPPTGAIITCFAATVSITLFHFLFWFFHILRIYLADKFRPINKISYDYENSHSQDDFNERKPLLERSV